MSEERVRKAVARLVEKKYLVRVPSNGIKKPDGAEERFRGAKEHKNSKATTSRRRRLGRLSSLFSLYKSALCLIYTYAVTNPP